MTKKSPSLDQTAEIFGIYSGSLSVAASATRKVLSNGLKAILIFFFSKSGVNIS